MYPERFKTMLAGVGVAFLVAGTAWAQTPITISVNTQSAGPAIPADFIGLSFGPSALQAHVFNSTNTQVLTIFQNLGIKYFRMGGTWVDTNSSDYTPSTQDVDSLFGFVKADGLTDVIYSLKLELGNSAQDASMASYIWSNYRQYLTCFAIGNEPNSYAGGDPAITNFSSYLAKWNSFAAAITSSVPQAIFGGPDTTDGSSWGASFANAQSKSSDVDWFHFHYYVGGSSSGMTAPQMISTMLSPAWDSNNYSNAYNANGATALSGGFSYRLTEANSFSDGNVPGGSDGFGSALFALDFMYWWAGHGCSGVSVHTGLSNLNGAIYQDALGNWQIFPWAYAIKAFGLAYTNGNLESVITSNPSGLNLTSYAVGNATNLYVTIINRENGTGARDASVTLTQNGFTSANVSIMYLLAPNGDLTATNGITLGGAFITNNAPWAGQWTGLNPIVNSQCVVTVTAGSAAVLKITPLLPNQAVLQAQMNGLGSISPDYSNAVLTIGQGYTVTAMPGTGFIFTNWTGGTALPLGVLTNGTTLQFTMQSNLVLQANFLDVTKPTLAITTPISGQHVNNGTFTVTGTAGDNWQVSNVWYQLNGQGWSNAVTANGWTNWTTTVTLAPGANTIRAYAVDTSGNISTTNSVNFQYVANVTGEAYFQAITNLNPVGYWPMHEVEAAASGDIETNYGSLGPLGTGYYPDWESASSRILHGYAGALAGDSDTATYFAAAKPNVSAGSATTNALYVPHTSPLATLAPPFSVECWFYATNSALGTNGQGDILGQSAYNGLNDGNDGSGNGNVCGFRLYWDVTRIEVFGYANSSINNNLGTATSLTTNKWYHTVVTCDASTNFILYVNGAPQSTNPGVGLYIPDYWMPFEVGNSRGNTHPINGIVDEVAIYTNALLAPDITNHYSTGINPNPNPGYFVLVTDDNPVIYLRMDSPTYIAPALNTWPVLTNYGSAGANGVYTPGTMPGILPGPTTSGGAVFGGLYGVQVAQLSGVSSFADAGYAAAYNPVGAVPCTVIAMFRGNPCDGRTNTIVGHTGNSWSLSLNTTGKLVWQLGTNVTALTSTGVYNDGHWHQAVAVYAPASNPNVTGTNSLYVDGTLDSSANGVSTNGIAPGSPLDVMIGTDPQYTNNPNGLGQQFAGQVCEVALFTNVLTAAQVQAIYSAAIVTPINLNPTNIVFSVTNNQLTLTWPVDHTGWILQAQTNGLAAGLGANWSNVSGSTNVNQMVVPISPNNGCVFYRLVYP